MDGLKTIREDYSRIDSIIPPIEEAFALLAKFEIEVDSDMANKCDSIRYAWKKEIIKKHSSKIVSQNKITFSHRVDVEFHIKLYGTLTRYRMEADYLTNAF